MPAAYCAQGGDFLLGDIAGDSIKNYAFAF